MKTTAESAEFTTMDPKAAKVIKPIRDAPELVADRAKIEELEARAKALLQEIIVAEHTPEAVVRSQSDLDAHRVLAGEPLVDGPPARSHLQDLRREKVAIEAAIKLLRERMDETGKALIRENLPQIEPVVRKYVAATMRALDDVRKAIEAEAALFAYLRKMRYRAGVPGHWSILPDEQRILSAAASVLRSRRAGFPDLK